MTNPDENTPDTRIPDSSVGATDARNNDDVNTDPNTPEEQARTEAVRLAEQGNPELDPTNPDRDEEKLVEASQKMQEAGDDYDPYADPIVPSSAVAENIVAELKTEGGEGSPTLDNLRTEATDPTGSVEKMREADQKDA